jgi:hypothetical protein
MPIWAPPVPNRDVFPTEVEHGKGKVAVRFRRNYFSDVNGKVIAYAVSSGRKNQDPLMGCCVTHLGRMSLLVYLRWLDQSA